MAARQAAGAGADKGEAGHPLVEAMRYCRWMIGLAISGLFAAYGLGLAADFGHVFDLANHFKLHYGVAGLVLTPLAWLAGLRLAAAAALVVAVVCLVETRAPLADPWAISAPPAGSHPRHITVVSYNHNGDRRDFGAVAAWLADPGQDFDLVVLQEANPGTVAMAEGLRGRYPHQVHGPRDHNFGMVVISRHPLLAADRLDSEGKRAGSLGYRVRLQPPRAPAPVTVYSIHPLPPMTAGSAAQRDFKLMQTADRIAADPDPHVILIGDLNTTPYAPVFKRMLARSGLRFQSYGLLMNPSWPAFNRFALLKIPIDHAAYSAGLIQIEKRIGPALGSDHHAVIARYALRRE